MDLQVGLMFHLMVQKEPKKNNQGSSIVLSTAPDKEPTHWKQELFIMNQVHQVEVNGRIDGNISIERNSYWKRHYNIDISYAVNNQNFSKTFDRWREKTQN